MKSFLFEGCENLQDVYYSGTKKQWENIFFSEYNDYFSNATIHFSSNKASSNASIKKISPAKASLTITWAKVKGVKGYEIQLATDKKFTKNLKKVTIKKQKTTKTTVKKLKAKKTYYVRIRTYTTKKINGKSTKVYSSWSKVKTVKTK